MSVFKQEEMKNFIFLVVRDSVEKILNLLMEEARSLQQIKTENFDLEGVKTREDLFNSVILTLTAKEFGKFVAGAFLDAAELIKVKIENADIELFVDDAREEILKKLKPASQLHQNSALR